MRSVLCKSKGLFHLCAVYVIVNDLLSSDLFYCGKVYAVDWSPDGEKVASGGKDRVLKLWMG